MRAKVVMRPTSSLAKKAANDADGYRALGAEWISGDLSATLQNSDTVVVTLIPPLSAKFAW